MGKKSPILSSTRNKILTIIFKDDVADKFSLERQLQITQSTLRDNLKALEKEGYIKSHHVDEQNQKSRIFYHLTPKGGLYAIGFLDMYKDIFVTHEYDDTIASLQGPDPQSRRDFHKIMAKVMILNSLFDPYGNPLNLQILIEKCAQIGFSLNGHSKTFADYISSLDIEKILTKDEYAKVKPHLSKILNNSIETSQTLKERLG